MPLQPQPQKYIIIRTIWYYLVLISISSSLRSSTLSSDEKLSGLASTATKNILYAAIYDLWNALKWRAMQRTTAAVLLGVLCGPLWMV